MCVYIYIYRERERYTYTYMYVYIYIYIERERGRETGSPRKYAVEVNDTCETFLRCNISETDPSMEAILALGICWKGMREHPRDARM